MAQPQNSLERLSTRELAARLKSSNIASQFGFFLRDAGGETVVLGMQVRKRHLQVHGVVHGGVLASFADTSGGLAVYFCLPSGSRVATIEMKINYLEAVDRGEVTAVARVIRLGKNIGVVDCDITDDAGRLVGKALMTFAVISRGRKGKGRQR
jgi:uncharacterized protein (TIGR00369 family)